MRRTLAPLLLALAAAGLLAFLGPEPGSVEAPRAENATDYPLGAAVVGAPEACSLCHYGWEVPFEFEGARNGSAYAFSLRPTADYTLVDVRALPVYEGSEQATLHRLPSEGEVRLGATTAHHLDVTEDAAALRVSLVGSREYGRSDLNLEVEAPDGRVVGSAEPGPVDVVVLKPAPAGAYAIRVTYADGDRPTEPYELEYDLATPTPAVVEEAAMDAPAAFRYDLDAPPRGFLVQFRTWNPHPTEAWTLPGWGDLGLYSVWVDARTPWEARAPHNWTDAELDEVWAGEDRRTLYELEIDGTFVRHRDERGEWSGRSVYRTPPGPEEPFPAVPPGTRELLVRIEAESANPVTPSGDWVLSYADASGPTFHFPEPDSVEGAVKTYRIPVEPDEWETGEKGAWQWFARLPFDEQGNAFHDGPVRLTVDALR